MPVRIVALFGCSALAVASTIPDSAEDADGRVASVEDDRLQLEDGRVFLLPPAFDAGRVMLGSAVHLLVVGEGGFC